MEGVLAGYRVLDFGRYIAGPYCASLLAEFGADVIRIEKRTGGEDRVQAPMTATREGPLFLQMNRNKRCLTLDPMKPEGQEVVRRLVATADVVIANLPPQTLAAMKLDYPSLKAVKPDIILTHVTAYGQGGPYSERVASSRRKPIFIISARDCPVCRPSSRSTTPACAPRRRCLSSRSSTTSWRWAWPWRDT